MSLTTDHSFHIGEQHLRNGKPNQDFALSGKLSDDFAYAIVADGCSSGGMTDIGARLMCLSTKQALTEYGSIADVLLLDEPIEIITRRRNEILAQQQQALGLVYQDMLATCVWALSSPDVAIAHIAGDGVIAMQYEHDLWIERTQWAENRPYYPAYALAGKNDEYLASFGEITEPFKIIRQSTVPGQGGIPDGFLSTHTGVDGLSGYTTVGGGVSDTWPGRLLSIGVFSDGLEQVDQLSFEESTKSLMSFKSTNGQFATRRMNRFLQDAKKQGRGPLDDIAMAVIHLGRDQEP